MTDAKYTRLDDTKKDRSGCFARLFRRDTVAASPEERAKQSDRQLRLLMKQIPAWMAEQQRHITLNEHSAQDCAARRDTTQAKVFIRAALARRRYRERLGEFYTNIDAAMVMQQNAKVARDIAGALGAATDALDRMMASMSQENIVLMMDRMEEQREHLDDINDELARPADPLASRMAEVADEDPEVMRYLSSLTAQESAPIPERASSVPSAEKQQQRIPVATTT